MTTSVDMGRFTLFVNCLKPYTGAGPAAPVWGWGEALKVFNTEAARLRAPQQTITGESVGQAKRLTAKYTKEQLTKMVYNFWQRHGDDVYNGEYVHPLRSFASKLAILEREVKSYGPEDPNSRDGTFGD